jgi:hypothetical protein
MPHWHLQRDGRPVCKRRQQLQCCKLQKIRTEGEVATRRSSEARVVIKRKPLDLPPDVGQVIWAPHSSWHAITFPQGGNCYFPFAVSPIFQPAD